jgi:hypothetical protein
MVAVFLMKPSSTTSLFSCTQEHHASARELEEIPSRCHRTAGLEARSIAGRARLCGRSNLRPIVARLSLDRQRSRHFRGIRMPRSGAPPAMKKVKLHLLLTVCVVSRPARTDAALAFSKAHLLASARWLLFGNAGYTRTPSKRRIQFCAGEAGTSSSSSGRAFSDPLSVHGVSPDAAAGQHFNMIRRYQCCRFSVVS